MTLPAGFLIYYEGSFSPFRRISYRSLYTQYIMSLSDPHLPNLVEASKNM